MNSIEISKSQPHFMVETIEYVPNSVVSKTIIKRSAGNICVMSFDRGEGITDCILPYDTFVQIIEGKAEIIIDGNSNSLESGEGIIIPAHISNAIKANERFKMLLTAIKISGVQKTSI